MGETIIYLRTSTEEQNPENQQKACIELAERLGLKEYEVFSEQQSAFKDTIKRQVFDSITSKINQNQVRTLICWDLDRLYRDRKKLIGFFEFCKIHRCKIFSVRQDWLESLNQIQEPFNEIMHSLMLQIMGWLAEEESRKKSERVKAAIRNNNGVTKSYRGNKWGRKRISTQKINLIKENQGKSMREISRIVGVSKSVVHKYLSKYKGENPQNTPVHQSTD